MTWGSAGVPLSNTAVVQQVLRRLVSGLPHSRADVFKYNVELLRSLVAVWRGQSIARAAAALTRRRLAGRSIALGDAAFTLRSLAGSVNSTWGCGAHSSPSGGVSQ